MHSSPGATRKVNGLVWPAYDIHCAQVVFDSIPDLERALGYCKNKRTVIQAGGNCGVWARHLAGIFSMVHTWEPDQLNYHCLARNTIGYRNVFTHYGALGARPGAGVMHSPEANNCGALQIDLTLEPAGSFPIETIDGMNERELGNVDLIYLDVEGHELFALQGAARVIAQSNPVIALEDKGLSERYGVAKGDVLRYLEQAHNYEVIDSYARDFVLRRKSTRSASE